MSSFIYSPKAGVPCRSCGRMDPANPGQCKACKRAERRGQRIGKGGKR